MIRTFDFGSTPIRAYPLFILPLIVWATILFLPYLSMFEYSRAILLRYATLSITLGTLCFMMPELYAGIEEQMFKNDCLSQPELAETIFRNRWWPFDNHYIGYDSKTRQFFGGD